MAQTADGYLWLGGQSGLFRFDGNRFELFHPESGDRLLSTNVRATFAPSTGGLWVGYRLGGFSFVTNGHVKNYASSSGMATSFAEGSDGTLWAGTVTGVCKFEGSTWRQLGAESAAPSGYTMLGVDRAGVLWVLTGWVKNKLFYLLPGSKRFMELKQYPAMMYFTHDADHKIVTTPISSRVIPDLSAIRHSGLPTFPVVREDSAQLLDRNSNRWIITPAPKPPLVRMRAFSLNDLLAKPTARNSEVYDLDPGRFAALADREGNVWFADDHGVHRFFTIPFVKEQLKPAHPAAMVADDEGGVWIGFWNWGVTQLYRATAKEIREINFGRELDWQAGYHARDRTLWFGESTGLWHIVAGTPLPIALPHERAGQTPSLQCMTEDWAGGLWVSFGRYGLYRWADGRWTSFGGREDLPRNAVYVEFTDILRRVWFGYAKDQLAVLDGDKVRVFGPNDGVRVGNVTAIYGRGSAIWIGGEFGLQHFEKGRFHAIHAVDENWLLGISGIVETSDGDLWLNGLTGIFHIDEAEIAEALKDPSYRVRGEHIGTREGLPGVAAEFPLPTAIQGSDGNLWFSLSGGVVRLDPTRPLQKAFVPMVTIQSVSADDKNYEINSALQFPAHTSSVAIRYTAISLSDPEAIRLRARLRETDSDWREVSKGEPVTYRNLEPGRYHFSVSASDTSGVWSDRAANMEFVISPAWYQTLWFRISMVAATVVVLWTLYRMRIAQISRAVILRSDERLAERTRMARDLHDTLLQTIQASKLISDDALEKRSDPEHMGRSMERISEWLRQAIQEGRAALNSLRASTKLTNDLAEALDRALREDIVPDFIRASLMVTGEVREMHPIVRDEIYRIAYEAIRNACLHSSATELLVEIEYGRDLTLRIRDNGVGMTQQMTVEGRSEHFGLAGMRERSQRIGAHLQIFSQPHMGTTITLRIKGSVTFLSESEKLHATSPPDGH
jgi:signal transduction histidine kinase/ligand-binding sensor domain-containing protein